MIILLNRLEVRNLNKAYGATKAVNNLSFDMENGIYGLVGHNGAGKSTLIKILATLMKADSGTVSFNGELIKDYTVFRSLLGYMPQNQSLPAQMTVEHFLFYIASLKAIPNDLARLRIEDLLTRFNLETKKHHKLSSLSGGMKQRVLLAQAMLNDPAVLILDEPTAGLDPVERSNLRNVIMELSGDKIVLIATHIISDIEYIADKIMLLQKGNIIEFDTPDKLILKMCVFESTLSFEAYKRFAQEHKIINSIRIGEQVRIRHFSDDIEGVKVNPTIEDLYLYALS
ncbi:ATP-binding cassette domain-containing protein [Erysipelothrix rhusiopathiae]|nr:ATP-binding cassette domain-containing protein [Erysipelothrix rhusiopathiae]MDE8253449.1 ATP-binding cassette domain-containing protein [Erysipelothrix rhusiopathiae]